MPAAKAYVLSGGRLLPLAGGKAVLPSTSPGGGGGGGGVGNRNAMLVGAASATASGSDFAALDAAAGPWTVRRSFDSGSFPSTWASSVAGIDVGKRASVWSCKPPVVALADGSLDDAVTSFVGSIPDTHVAVLTIWHEPDAKIRQKTKDPAGTVITAANYIAAHRQFASLVRAVGKPHVYIAQIVTCYSGIHQIAGSNYPDIWPGNDYVDIFMADGYENDGSGAALWQPAVDFARSKNVPWGIGETGCSGAPNAAWMQTQADYAGATPSGNRPRCAIFCWFSNSTGGVVPTPGDDPDMQATSRAIARSYFTDVNAYLL